MIFADYTLAFFAVEGLIYASANVTCASLSYLFRTFFGYWSILVFAGNSIDSTSLCLTLLPSFLNASSKGLNLCSDAGDLRIRLTMISSELRCSTAVSFRFAPWADLLSILILVAKSKSNFYFFCLGGELLLNYFTDKYLGFL